MDNWIKKIWYRYSMEYYSAVRKDEILPFVTEHGWILRISCWAKYVRWKKSRTIWFHSNEQTHTHRHRQQYAGSQRESGAGEVERVKGVKYMMTEGDLSLDHEQTMQYTDDIELYTWNLYNFINNIIQINLMIPLPPNIPCVIFHQSRYLTRFFVLHHLLSAVWSPWPVLRKNSVRSV